MEKFWEVRARKLYFDFSLYLIGIVHDIYQANLKYLETVK